RSSYSVAGSGRFCPSCFERGSFPESRQPDSGRLAELGRCRREPGRNTGSLFQFPEYQTETCRTFCKRSPRCKKISSTNTLSYDWFPKWKGKNFSILGC